MGDRYFLKHLGRVVVLGDVLPAGILLAEGRRATDAPSQCHKSRWFYFCCCCHQLVWLLLFAAPDGELLGLVVWVRQS
jgi:hypothetical protein